MGHEWMPSRVGHGTSQCKHCLCTDLEAAHALGPVCPVKRPVNPLRLVGGTDTEQ